MTNLISLEYIWIDGAKPTPHLRSKTRIVHAGDDEISLGDCPEWGFDGSSTNQAEGHDSDLILKPVAVKPNPLSITGGYLVMCEVLLPDGTPHPTNKRHKLAELQNKYSEQEAWIGFEQEYTLFKGRDPLGWPEGGYPAPQGPFYCGVGADEVFGRELVEAHTQACLDANLMIFGINAEVMPGQWEFQIGYRAVPGESADPLSVSDNLWLARWLLYRIGEDFGVSATLHPKPVKGDWNGAGKHTNFSTKAMRDKSTGQAAIDKAIIALEKNHAEHIKIYGADLDERLTGLHETAPIEKFTSGVSDRTCSIRIPRSVAKNGYGYIEDRRPGANADPYEVSSALMNTVCGS